MYCGPYALAAYYREHGNPTDSISLAREINVTRSEGSDARHLIMHAVASGYRVERYVWNTLANQRETAEELSAFGVQTFLGVSLSVASLRKLAERPFIANIEGSEYIRQLSRRPSERRCRVFRHFLFVRNLCADGYYACDDAFSTVPEIWIPEDMLSRMLLRYRYGSIIFLDR